MYEMLKVRGKPDLYGGAAFGVQWKGLMPSLRNAWNNEAYDEDKRINRKLYEKSAMALAASDQSTPIPPLRLRAVLTEATSALNSIAEHAQAAVQLLGENKEPDLSEMISEWNGLVAKLNPLVIGPGNVGMSDEDTNALHSLVSNTLLQPLEALQVASDKRPYPGDYVVRSKDIARNILSQVQAKYYKAVPYTASRASAEQRALDEQPQQQMSSFGPIYPSVVQQPQGQPSGPGQWPQSNMPVAGPAPVVGPAAGPRAQKGLKVASKLRNIGQLTPQKLSTFQAFENSDYDITPTTANRAAQNILSQVIFNNQQMNPNFTISDRDEADLLLQIRQDINAYIQYKAQQPAPQPAAPAAQTPPRGTSPAAAATPRGTSPAAAATPRGTSPAAAAQSPASRGTSPSGLSGILSNLSSLFGTPVAQSPVPGAASSRGQSPAAAATPKTPAPMALEAMPKVRSPAVQRDFVWKDLLLDQKIALLNHALANVSPETQAALKKFSEKSADVNHIVAMNDPLNVIVSQLKKTYPNASFPKGFGVNHLVNVWMSDTNQQKFFQKTGYGRWTDAVSKKGYGRWTDYSGPQPDVVPFNAARPKMRGGNYRDTPSGTTENRNSKYSSNALDFDDEDNDPNELGDMTQRDEMIGGEMREAHLDPDWKGLPKRWGIERRIPKLRKGYINPKEKY